MTKKLFLVLLSTVLCLTVALPAAQAAASPPLNLATDNPVLGDETDFLRIAPHEEGEKLYVENFLSREVTLEVDKVYSLFVYYDNSGETTLEDVTLILSVPSQITPGSNSMISAMLVTGGDEPGIVDSEITFHTDQALNLSFSGVESKTPDRVNTCNEAMKEWKALPFTAVTVGGVTSVTIVLGDIEPGYLASRYLFFALTTSAAPDQAENDAMDAKQTLENPPQHGDELKGNELWMALGGAILIVFIACTIGEIKKRKEQRKDQRENQE